MAQQQYNMKGTYFMPGLIPRPFHCPVFDCDQKLDDMKGTYTSPAITKCKNFAWWVVTQRTHKTTKLSNEGVGAYTEMSACLIQCVAIFYLYKCPVRRVCITHTVYSEVLSLACEHRYFVFLIAYTVIPSPQTTFLPENLDHLSSHNWQCKLFCCCEKYKQMLKTTYL